MRLERLAKGFCGFALAAIIVCSATGSAQAYATSDLGVQDVDEPDGSSGISISTTRGGKSSLPEELQDGAPSQEEMDEDYEADPHGHSGDDNATVMPPPAASIGDVVWDVSLLPHAVRETRAKLLEAARTGNIEALRPIFEQQSSPPLVAGVDLVPDAVDHLRLQSGDEQGREILAILLELLESGHVRIGDNGSRTYVWPYFAEVPLEELKDPHYVELYRVLTAIDVEEIARQGRYTFFRVGISSDGSVRYFTAGDLE